MGRRRVRGTGCWGPVMARAGRERTRTPCTYDQQIRLKNTEKGQNIRIGEKSLKNPTEKELRKRNKNDSKIKAPAPGALPCPVRLESATRRPALSRCSGRPCGSEARLCHWRQRNKNNNDVTASHQIKIKTILCSSHQQLFLLCAVPLEKVLDANRKRRKEEKKVGVEL